MSLVQLHTRLRLRCADCGITQEAACGCGVAYVPAQTAAANFAERHPEMSNVAVAKQLGIHERTVRRGKVGRQNAEGIQLVENKENNTRIPPKDDHYFQRLARPPTWMIKEIMALIRNLDPDQREALFVKIRKRWRL